MKRGIPMARVLLGWVVGGSAAAGRERGVFGASLTRAAELADPAPVHVHGG